MWRSLKFETWTDGDRLDPMLNLEFFDELTWKVTLFSLEEFCVDLLLACSKKSGFWHYEIVWTCMFILRLTKHGRHVELHTWTGSRPMRLVQNAWVLWNQVLVFAYFWHIWSWQVSLLLCHVKLLLHWLNHLVQKYFSTKLLMAFELGNKLYQNRRQWVCSCVGQAIQQIHPATQLFSLKHELPSSQ